MGVVFSPANPTSLYAFILKLRPQERGLFLPFSGELVHAAFLNWIRSIDPDIAEWLHEGNKRRLFTCSSLQFPLSESRIREAERTNRDLPLEPTKIYTIRITLLFGELFPLLCRALRRFEQERARRGKALPFMVLGRHLFYLEDVVLPTAPSPWTGFTSFDDLVEQTRAQRLQATETLSIDFTSLTSFNWLNPRCKIYGNYSALLPLPGYMFPSLARRWQELAPEDLSALVQPERIEQYIQEDGIVIKDYELQVHRVRFSNHFQNGFLGCCTYLLRGPDPCQGTSLTIRQQLFLLTRLAFYCGIGYKTTMGMGQVRVS